MMPAVGRSRWRVATTALLAGVALGLVGCDADGNATAEPPPSPGEVRAERAAEERDDEDEARAAPRWEDVAEPSGEGDATETVAIDGDIVQWRVRWECDGDGRFALTVDGDDEPLVEEACGESGEAFSTATGDVDLAVSADGTWRLEVAQQLDTPVHEPPLAEMDHPDAEVIAAGELYEIERRTDGRVELYELPDGQLAVRIEDLDTVPEPGLYVWLSQAPEPDTTEAVTDHAHVDIGHVTSTLGDHNYLVPDDVAADDIQSVVLWCQPIRIAYGAAPMQR